MAKQTPEALYKKKLKFIETSLDDFDKDMRVLQAKLFDDLLTNYISQLTVVGGVVADNKNNIRLLAELQARLTEFKNTFANRAFAKLGNNMIEMTSLTSDYFNSLVGSKKTIANIMDKLKGYSDLVGIDKRGKIISGSFLDNLAENAQMRTKLSNYMMNSVAGQTDYKTFLKGFKDIVKGGDGINGAYEKYTTGYAHDTFFSQGQQQDNFFADQLGLNYFVYEGSAIKDTRDFCRDRHGKVFSREEAEGWNDMDWQGKIPGLDFFVQRGGYNCRHILRWITDDKAEREG